MDEDSKNLAIKVLINSLGNLTIIRDKKNSALQDSSWKEKRDRYGSGCFSELEISTKKEGKDFEHIEWNEETIYERGLKMIHFMEDKIDGLTFDEHEINEILFDRDLFYPKSLQQSENDLTDNSIIL